MREQSIAPAEIVCKFIQSGARQTISQRMRISSVQMGVSSAEPPFQLRTMRCGYRLEMPMQTCIHVKSSVCDFELFSVDLAVSRPILPDRLE